MEVKFKLRTLVGWLILAVSLVCVVKPDWVRKIDWPWPGVITDPTPITEAGIHIAVFHESTGKSGELPPWWNSLDVQTWFKTNAAGNWRVIDKDTPVTAEPPWVTEARTAYDNRKDKTVGACLVYSNGKKGGIIAVPTDKTAFLALLNGLLK